MNKFILILLFITLASSSLIPLSEDETQSLYTSQKEFVISLLKSLEKTQSNGNQILSPHSVYHALLLAYFGAEGQTEHSLRKALHLDWAKNKNEVYKSYQNMKLMRNKRNSVQNIEFRSVDKIYVADQVELTSEMEIKFQDNVEKMNFHTDAEGARQHINHFVENITNGYIKDLLPAGSIQPFTNLVLANAAFFKGNWEKKFNSRLTKQKPFINGATVNMMNQKSRFIHGKSGALNASFIEMPYEGEHGSVSMYVVLPNEKSSEAIDTLLDKLTIDYLDDIFEFGWEKELNVQLPKFENMQNYMLQNTFTDMGIDQLFHNSNFSGISKSDRLSFDDIIHQAKIIVDEEGAVAAAATASFSRSMAFFDEQPIDFICDHPFMYFIYDKIFEEILFVGVYRNP